MALPHEIKQARILDVSRVEVVLVHYRDQLKTERTQLGFRTDVDQGYFFFPIDLTNQSQTMSDGFIDQVEEMLGKKREDDRIKTLEKKVIALEKKLKGIT